MHLVTGFLLTALLGKKRAKTCRRLPSFPGILEIEHVLPGRMRLRAPALIGRSEFAADVQTRLEKLEGLASADANSVSGSLLLKFDSRRIEPEIMLAASIRVLGLEEQVAAAPRSRVGHEMREIGAALNRAIHDQTGGLIDLWTGLPLLLVVLGIRNVVARNGQLGWPLLWWAYLALFPPGRNQD